MHDENNSSFEKQKRANPNAPGRVFSGNPDETPPAPPERITMAIVIARIAKYLIYIVIVLGIFWYYMADEFFMKSETGLKWQIQRTAKDALAHSKFKDLSLENIGEAVCTGGKAAEMRYVYECKAPATYSNGQTSDICITKEEFRRENRKHAGLTVLKSLNLTVNLCGLDKDASSTRTFSEGEGKRR